jgi:hypothetical protein
MNTIKVTETTYWILDSKHGKLEKGQEFSSKTEPFSTTDKAEWLEKLGVISEKELEDNKANELEAKKLANQIQSLKNKLISQVKNKVSELLTATDYKVIRHRDQLELGVETTLTDLEYDALLKQRNDLRIKSNELEATIKAKRSLNTLNEIKIEF